MLKNLIITALGIVALISIQASSADENIKYQNIAEANSLRAGEIVIRYLRELGNPCITVQTLEKIDDWKVISSKYFCSINGLSFRKDLADAHFENISLFNDRVSATLSITPLEPTGEQRFNCLISISKKTVQEISCAAQASH